MYINLKRKHILIWSVILAVLLFAIVYISFRVVEITYGKKLILEDNTLNLSSYYTEYDATVISNKNVNTYFVKEWYKEEIGSKIEYLDYMGNVVSVVTTPDSCHISNAGNKAYILTQNLYGTENILSLATYMNIFNSKIICSCIKNVYEKNGEINIMYDVCNKEACTLNEGVKRIGVSSFELTVMDNTPTTYTIYTGNKKEYVCIVYNKFDANILIEDSIFNISK